MLETEQVFTLEHRLGQLRVRTHNTPPPTLLCCCLLPRHGQALVTAEAGLLVQWNSAAVLPLPRSVTVRVQAWA